MNRPLLTTDRLELWQPALRDLADLYHLTLDDETRRFLGGFTPSEADAFARLHRNAGSWALHGYGTFMVRLRDLDGAPLDGLLWALPAWIGKPIAFVLSLPALYIIFLVLRAYASRGGKRG